MDRYDDFIKLCEKFNKNVNKFMDVKEEKRNVKDDFFITSSKIYTKLFSACEYIDNNTLKEYGLYMNSSSCSSIYFSKYKPKGKNKDNLLFLINNISEDIKNLEPQVQIHNDILNCLNNLLSIFVDIINKYDNNLSNYNLKLNTYTTFYFYDVKSVKCNFDFLNKLNTQIYGSDIYINKSKDNNSQLYSSLQRGKHIKVNKQNDNSLYIQGGDTISQGLNDDKHVHMNDMLASQMNIKRNYINDDINTYDNNNNNNNNIYVNNSTGGQDINLPTHLNSNENIKIHKSNLRKRRDLNNNSNNNNNNNSSKQVHFNTYSYLDEENNPDESHNNNIFYQNNLLSNNQKLEFKKYVDLFEKEENTYIMETKKKIAKISNLMNIFVNKIYEQNENLKMIETIIEESIDNVSQGNNYLTKIKNKKNINSLIFFFLICTSIFLFILDFFK
ncbi:syntaxin, Qa-SNARE family [Plasmodium gaboni]|uniref:Syntaxin, Qa-SNARE family n=1 Tax=Plasmodium gaboni TaxID=647221 RepID=A0ABY1UST3_9APIC|nr:syntaxin, Qa-SNARE family [Plasmodium gaboni]